MNLLRFISRGLDVETVVVQQGSDILIQVMKNDELVGSRRLAKASCCQADSPCIGAIPISSTFQQKYDLPAFVHVSLCFREINESLEPQDQT